jgi:hypothetical protein
MQWQVFDQSCRRNHITRVSFDVELSKNLSCASILFQMQEIINWPVCQVFSSFFSQVSNNRFQIACSKSCILIKSCLVSSLDSIISTSGDKVNYETILFHDTKQYIAPFPDFLTNITILMPNRVNRQIWITMIERKEKTGFSTRTWASQYQQNKTPFLSNVYLSFLSIFPIGSNAFP